MTDKTTLKFVVKTKHVPCYVGPHFKMAVLISDLAAPLKHLVLCGNDPPQKYHRLCFWLVTCACPEPSVPCVLYMSIFSGDLAEAGKPWKIKKLGPVWAEAAT